MKTLLVGLVVLVFFGALTSVAAADAVRATLPPGGEIVPPGDGGPRVPCDITIRYDDGSDDSPGSGPTLGYWGGTDHQFLGVVSTAPAGGNFEVQSASWYSDFWVWPGMVDVTVYEMANPTNTTTETVNVTGGGTWEVEFLTPICVPGGTDYVVMLCPQPGVWGVVGDDYAGPDNRSYWTPSTSDPVNNSGAVDYMIWSCVTPCGGTPTEETSWGNVKSLYR